MLESSQLARKRRLWHGLSFRLGMGLCLGAVIILIAAGLWNLRLQRAHLTRLVASGAERSVGVISSSTREGMLHNRPGEVRRIIETIAVQPDIELIRVLDKQGNIRISSHGEEVGTMVDSDAEQCFACHTRDEPLDRLDQDERVRIFRNPANERILGVIAPIRNEPECANAACHAHPPSQRVLGVLDVQLSLRSVDQDLAASERQMFIAIVAAVGAVLILAWLLTWRLVLRPVRRLTTAAAAVAAGDYSTQLPVTSTDALGRLTQAWNSMVGELGRARDQLRDWAHALENRVEEKSKELEKVHQHVLLVEKMASLGKLAAVVAHEINNPLTGIQTYARLLRRRQEEDAAPSGPAGEAVRILKMIEEEAARCGKIVRNLLLFSRTPGARFSQEALQGILERTVLLLWHQAELQGVDLRLTTEPGLPKLTCDSSQIQQMALALVMNALDAVPAGGAVEIHLGHDPEAEELIVKVSDNGRGIPSEHLDKIFEPFFTTKEEGAGVGLGLSVVYGIVTRHRGRIEVESSPDFGTVFTVRLPLQPSEDSRAEEQEQKVLP